MYRNNEQGKTRMHDSNGAVCWLVITYNILEDMKKKKKF